MEESKEEKLTLWALRRLDSDRGEEEKLVVAIFLSDPGVAPLGFDVKTFELSKNEWDTIQDVLEGTVPGILVQHRLA